MQTEKELEKWLENLMTTPHKETQQELPLQHSSESTDAEIEDRVKLLIGQMLRLNLLADASATLLETERQSNLGTPVMEVHTLSVLSATVSLLMSTSDLLRTYQHTWSRSLPTTLNEAIVEELLPSTELFIEELMDILANF